MRTISPSFLITGTFKRHCSPFALNYLEIAFICNFCSSAEVIIFYSAVSIIDSELQAIIFSINLNKNRFKNTDILFYINYFNDN